MNSGLYRIVNIKNGKFYIGSTDDFKRRKTRHWCDLKKNQHNNQYLQHSWNKHGEASFVFEVYKMVESSQLLAEEQKELTVFVGTNNCYNLRKDAVCPVAVGERRSESVKLKISMSQKGKPRWTEEQKKQMSIDRKGRKHSTETLEKFKNRKSSYENVKKAQLFNVGRKYPKSHRENISNGKLKNGNNSSFSICTN